MCLCHTLHNGSSADAGAATPSVVTERKQDVSVETLNVNHLAHFGPLHRRERVRRGPVVFSSVGAATGWVLTARPLTTIERGGPLLAGLGF